MLRYHMKINYKPVILFLKKDQLFLLELDLVFKASNIKSFEAITQADVIIYDSLVNEELLKIQKIVIKIFGVKQK